MIDVALNASILVLEDDTDELVLLSTLLRKFGYRDVTLRSDSSDIWRDVELVQPDLLLLDLHISPVGGLEILETVRKLTTAENFFPVLILTGDSTKAARDRALANGAMDFLAKPYDPMELKLRMRNLLYTRSLNKELKQINTELEQRVHERTRELEHAYSEMLQRLSHAAEYRDDATGEHTLRVATLTKDIARALGFDEEHAELIADASLLHDLGKIGVKDEILLKPGRLDEKEFEHIKSHTRTGGEILKDSQSRVLQLAESIARYHHEKWDGTGYEGLRGSQIPIEARIVAIADVYDALTTERPYKEAWTHSDAVTEIRCQSGKHFDPNVVAAFERAIQFRGTVLKAIRQRSHQ